MAKKTVRVEKKSLENKRSMINKKVIKKIENKKTNSNRNPKIDKNKKNENKNLKTKNIKKFENNNLDKKSENENKNLKTKNIKKFENNNLDKKSENSKKDVKIKNKKFKENNNLDKKSENSKKVGEIKKSDLELNILKKLKTGLSEVEKKLLDKGTYKDKIDTISLSIIKNKYDFDLIYYLISHTLEGRNDHMLLALKNLKDIILENPIILSNLKLRTKITFTFRKAMKNQFIALKVLEILYELLEKGILIEELLHNFIDKVGAKKDISGFIEKSITILYRNGIREYNKETNENNKKEKEDKNNIKIETQNEKDIKEIGKYNKNIFKKDIRLYITNELEELYFKSTNIRLHKNIIKLFMNIKTEHADKIIIKIFNTTQILDETLLDILSKRANLIPNPDIKNLDRFLKLQSEEFLKLLFRIKDKNFGDYLVFMINQNKFKSEEILKIILEYLTEKKNGDKVVESLLTNGLFCDKEMMITILLIVKNIYKDEYSYLLSPYLNYFDPVVKKLANKIMKKETVIDFNPKNPIELELFSKMK